MYVEFHQNGRAFQVEYIREKVQIEDAAIGVS